MGLSSPAIHYDAPSGQFAITLGSQQLAGQHLHKFVTSLKCPGYLEMALRLQARCPPGSKTSVKRERDRTPAQGLQRRFRANTRGKMMKRRDECNSKAPSEIDEIKKESRISSKYDEKCQLKGNSH